MVAEIRARIDRLMATFPENIRKDYEQTKSRQVKPTAAGNFPSG